MTPRIFAFTYCCLLLVAADKPKPSDSKSDLDLLQGNWEFVYFEAEGEKLPPETYKGSTAVIKGDKLTMGLGEKTDVATITLDPSMNPKWIQTKGKDGDLLLGIYKIEGDKLTICLSKMEKDRPKEFATKKGMDHGLFVLKKKKS